MLVKSKSKTGGHNFPFYGQESHYFCHEFHLDGACYGELVLPISCLDAGGGEEPIRLFGGTLGELTLGVWTSLVWVRFIAQCTLSSSYVIV